MKGIVIAKTADMHEMLGEYQFVPVPGFENEYLVNMRGMIKSVARNGTLGGFIRQATDRYGYKKVVLRKNDKPHYFTVHRIVALAFISNPEKKKTVNHIDNIRFNNNCKNLSWATIKENLYHSHKQKRQTWNNTPVIAKNLVTGERFLFESQHEASRATGLNQGTINNVLKGRDGVKKCKGWTFYYA